MPSFLLALVNSVLAPLHPRPLTLSPLRRLRRSHLFLCTSRALHYLPTAQPRLRHDMLLDRDAGPPSRSREEARHEASSRARLHRHGDLHTAMWRLQGGVDGREGRSGACEEDGAYQFHRVRRLRLLVKVRSPVNSSVSSLLGAWAPSSMPCSLVNGHCYRVSKSYKIEMQYIAAYRPVLFLCAAAHNLARPFSNVRYAPQVRRLGFHRPPTLPHFPLPFVAFPLR